MIRSAPPASAHLAERPVPAPAPMIGLPCVDLARAAARAPRSASRVALDQLVQPVGHRVGERGVVDVQRRARAPRRLGRASRAAPSNSASSAAGSWNGPPSVAIIETPFSGTNSAVGPVARGELARRSGGRARRTPPASCASASPSGCGRRGCGPRTARGTVSRGPKLTMSSAPSETTCGSPSSPAASSRSGPGREHAADEVVGQLGRRHVEHAGEEAAARERLHRLAAGAGRVEDEHLVAELLEPLARARHARRRDAEHRRADQRPARRRSPARVALAMPAIAPAALARIRAEIRLRPEMSTTE